MPLTPRTARSSPTAELPLAATLRLGSVLWLTLAAAVLMIGGVWVSIGVSGAIQRLVLIAILVVLLAGAWGLGALFAGSFWPAMHRLLPQAKRLTPQETAQSGIRDRIRLMGIGFVALAIVLVDELVWGIAGAFAPGLVMAGYFLVVWGGFMHLVARDLTGYERLHGRVIYILPEQSVLDIFAPRFGYLGLIPHEVAGPVEDRGQIEN